MSSDDEGDVRSRVNARKHVSDLSDLSDNDDNDNKQPASNVEDDIFGDDGGDDGGHDDGEDHDGKQLFGESDEEAENEPHTKHEGRTLDDEQLDSGDDEGLYDRQGDYMMDEEGEAEQGRINVMDLDLARAPDLESTDGEVYTLNVPNFLSIETEDFNPETYVPPPFNAASTSICWRYDPENEEKVQSNARIIKWEDGSMTLQLASSPKDQYRITSKRLARSHNAPTTNDYNSQLDSHVYLGVPSESANVIRISSHLTSQLNVLPTNMEMDDAVERLRDSLAAAQSKGRELPTFEVKEDPELAKKQAEMAEREKLRADRKRIKHYYS
ncbi:hypothetical protein KEM55_006550 [Ascosphaera atra]|nr:hypothetical protein KEM55_006550 [Ascosphaera atra]